jgi:hypothetical protein
MRVGTMARRHFYALPWDQSHDTGDCSQLQQDSEHRTALAQLRTDLVSYSCLID